MSDIIRIRKQYMGILICGLNGTGKSTLGKMLADRIGYEFIDNEDLYFPKIDAGYTFSNPRSKEEAVRLLEEKIDGNDRFVFAAVKGDYGDKLLASLDHIVLVEVPKQIRSQRVRNRSFSRFGERILPGGDLYDKEEAWFSLTDSRTEDYTAKWLETVNCPVIRIDGTLSVRQNVDYIVSAISTVHTGSYVCKIASMEEMEQKWNYEIAQHSEKENWIVWKSEAIESAKAGRSIPYYGILDGTVICEATAVLNSDFGQAYGKSDRTVELCAFRTIKEYRGKGYFSKLITFLQEDLKRKGYKQAIVGVEPEEKRNREIYRHWGFTEKVGTGTETYPDGTVIMIDFFGKKL